MEFKTSAGGVAIVGALLSAGCVAMTRVTLAPTLDTLGNVGADVRLSITPAVGGEPSRGDGGGWLAIDPSIGGSYLGAERAGAAHLRLAPELGVAVDRVVLRAGLGYSGLYSGPLSQCSGASTPGALLDGPVAYFGIDAPLRRIKDVELRYVSLGTELTAEYLWSTGPCGVPNRGLFSLGGLSISLFFQISPPSHGPPFIL